MGPLGDLVRWASVRGAGRFCAETAARATYPGHGDRAGEAVWRNERLVTASLPDHGTEMTDVRGRGLLRALERTGSPLAFGARSGAHLLVAAAMELRP